MLLVVVIKCQKQFFDKYFFPKVSLFLVKKNSLVRGFPLKNEGKIPRGRGEKSSG
jgi:hypothetical protein